mgnify:CR=1 FL=1
MNNVLMQAKRLAIPTKIKNEKLNNVANTAMKLVSKEITKYTEITSIHYGGSYAKGTWTSEKPDIDIFVKFKKSTSEKKFKSISKKIGFDALKKFKPYTRYSEHPFVEAIIKNIKINIVPCYDVKAGEWKSAADRSTFHTEFILENLSGPLKDDVRILKYFMSVNGIYGAEIAKQGFSGYVAEVLVYYFGSFTNVLKEIAKLKNDNAIGKPRKKFDSTIIIIDPVDSNRNLGAAISTENVGKFILLSRAFINKPSIQFFRNQRKKLSSKNILNNILVLKFQYKKSPDDTIAGQIRRAVNSLSSQMEIAGFKILRNSSLTLEKNQAVLLFLMDSLTISENQIHDGPSVFEENFSRKFVSINRKKSRIMWIGNNAKIMALQKRSHTNAKIFLNDLIQNHLNKSGIPNGIKPDIKNMKITTGNNIADKSIKEVILELVTTNDKIFHSNY